MLNCSVKKNCHLDRSNKWDLHNITLYFFRSFFPNNKDSKCLWLTWFVTECWMHLSASVCLWGHLKGNATLWFHIRISAAGAWQCAWFSCIKWKRCDTCHNVSKKSTLFWAVACNSKRPWHAASRRNVDAEHGSFQNRTFTDVTTGLRTLILFTVSILI